MPRQHFTGESVLEAAQRRIGWVFDRVADGSLNGIIVSVSGGKDSTVLAHLALTEAARRGVRIGVHVLDEEVMYQSSVEQVAYLMELFPGVTIKQWLQIPFNLTNATSREEGQLGAWDPGKHKTWMRHKRDDAIKAKFWPPEKETIRDKNKGFGFYDVIDTFSRCYSRTAFLVGIRASGESINRWRAVAKNPVTIGDHSVYWGTRKEENWTLYPIYDWQFHDIWRYVHDHGVRYSKIYDLQHKKGYAPEAMRVSSLIHEKSFKCLTDLQEFEPATYNRLLKRVKGIALAAETGRDAKMFRVAKLPKNFRSWVAYRDFLLATHPDEERRHLFVERFRRHLTNEYVARQQCRQVALNDYENNLVVDNRPDPRDELIRYYDEVL